MGVGDNLDKNNYRERAPWGDYVHRAGSDRVYVHFTASRRFGRWSAPSSARRSATEMAPVSARPSEPVAATRSEPVKSSLSASSSCRSVIFDLWAELCHDRRIRAGNVLRSRCCAPPTSLGQSLRRSARIRLQFPTFCRRLPVSYRPLAETTPTTYPYQTPPTRPRRRTSIQARAR